MRLGVIPETPLEGLALRLGLVPTPLVDTHLMFAMARSIMVAADRGVFEALADGPKRAEEVAAACDLDPAATRQLLTALTGVRYLQLRRDRYRLRRSLRRWLGTPGGGPLLAKLRFQKLEWELVAHYDHYLASGEPAELHRRLDADDWQRYGGAMRDLARLSAAEVARRTPLPRGARQLLDIGGAHGLYAAALCARRPALRALVLDLPDAVAQAAPHLAEELRGRPGDLASRVRHRAGDVFATDLGVARFDVVFASQFVHHFDEAANRELTRRVARALRPGGVYVVQDFVRPESAAEVRRLGAGALLDLYFGATSAAGTWSLREITDWQRAAGLSPRRPRWLRTLLGAAQQAAVKHP